MPVVDAHVFATTTLVIKVSYGAKTLINHHL